jgi:hypothetical protein
MAEFHLKFHHSIEIFFSSKQQNKLILGINLLISNPVLKISTFSMTSTDMITSVASLTSTASLTSKNQKLYALYILSDLVIFLLEGVEAMDFNLTKSKGDK